jgi:uncharacterized protein YqfB (UPF0267 family)
VGPALKKSLISQDTPKSVQILVGVAALLTGGVTGVVGYLAAAPRCKSDGDVLASRRKAVEDLLGESPTVLVKTHTPGTPISSSTAPRSRFDNPSDHTSAPPTPERILASASTPAGRTGQQAASDFLRLFDELANNAKAWTISPKDEPEFHKWMGDTVRVVKAETDRLTAMMDSTFAELPASEAKAFRDAVAERLTNMQGSKYEKEKKFPTLLRHLEEGYQKVG